MLFPVKRPLFPATSRIFEFEKLLVVDKCTDIVRCPIDPVKMEFGIPFID